MSDACHGSAVVHWPRGVGERSGVRRTGARPPHGSDRMTKSTFAWWCGRKPPCAVAFSEQTSAAALSERLCQGGHWISQPDDARGWSRVG